MTYEELLQRYEIREGIVETNFSKVYKAWDTKLERFVIVKISSTEHGKYRLKYEIKLIKQLKEHTNIATYIDFETCEIPEDGEFDIAIMEFYEEGSLRNFLPSDNFSYDEKVSILNQILSGINYLHEHNIVHRDLKPENILIAKQDGEFVPKISDFGVSKDVEGVNDSRFSNTGVGTLLYAAPEQMGGKDCKKNVDLWSFGLIAFEIFIGELPFKGYPYQLPDAINVIPEPWQELIRQCLEPDASKRINSVPECRDILSTNPSIQDIVTPPIEQEKITKEGENKDNDESSITNVKKPKKRYWFIPTVLLAAVLLYLLMPQIKDFFTFPKDENRISQGVGDTTTSTEQKDSIPNKELLRNKEDLKASQNTSTVSVQPTTKTPSNSQQMADVTDAQKANSTNSEKKENEFVKLMDNKMPMIEVRGDYNFKIGKYEITQEQWKLVMSELPTQRIESAMIPVHNVSWKDVESFIRELNQKTGCNYRLPTEAEWKYAAKGGAKSNAFLYSGSNEIDNIAVYNNDIRSSLQSVGSKKPNELGIYDMSGNVSEWCQGQVTCGGNWFSKAEECLVQTSGRRTTGGDSKIGFRLIYEIN